MSTNDGIIYVITCNPHGQRRELDYRQLQQSHSMLAGLGRRFSSLIFGGGAAEEQQGSGVSGCTVECVMFYM